MPDRPTYGELEQRLRELENVEAEKRKLEEALAERKKELRCVHEMARLIEIPEITVDDILQGIADIIPPSWHHPENTCVRVLFHEREFLSENFRETEWSQGADFIVNGEKAGSIQVFRTDASDDENRPFLEEEQALLDLMAERLGRVIERIHAQEALHESEERFRTFFMNSLDAVLITSPDGSIETANPAACKLFGMSESELLSGGREAVGDAADPRIPAALEERKRTGHFHGELNFKRKDGSVFPGEVSSSLFRDRHGKMRSAMIIRDRSEIQKIMDELRESRAILKAALDNSQAGIAIAEAPDGALRYVNDAGLLIRGGSREEIVNGVGVNEYVSSWRILDLDGTPLERDEVPLTRALLYGETNSREFIVRRSNEEDRIVWANAAPIRAENDEIIAAIVVFLDVTERKLMNQELHERERYLATILDTTADGFLVLGNHGKVVEVNNAYCRMSGYNRDELIGMGIGDLDVDETTEMTAERITRIIEIGSEIFDARHRRKDGSIFPVEISVTYLKEKGGRFICFCRDLTERKEAGEALRASEELLNETGDLALVGGWDIDFDTDEVIWTKTTRKIHEVPDDFRPTVETAVTFYPGESGRKIVEAVTAAREKGIPYDLELEFETYTGRRRWVRAVGKPEFRDGACVRLHGTFQDITERKIAEDEIRKRTNLLERIFEILPIGLWIADKDGTLLRGNPAGVAIWGAEPHVPISEYGVFKAWRLPSHEPVEAEEWALAKTIRNGETIVDEMLEIEAFDGTRKIILNYTAPVLDENGSVDGAIVVNLDVSERKELENQLAQAQKLESVGRLAGGVAHDFNNMLSVITGNAELLLNELGPENPSYPDLLEIQGAALRSADLTRQLLAFARKQTVAPKVLDLNETIGSMLKMLKRLIGEDIDLLWKPEDGLDPIRIDPSQIDQVLANLLVNARDAIGHDGGKVTIETGSAVFDEAYCASHAGYVPGHYVMLAVSDDGCGMDEEVRAIIFEPFFTTKEYGEGTGLGLATVYGIVKQNDGFINVYSEPGQGTTFRIYLPVYHRRTKEVQKRSAQNASIASGTDTILLAEDEQAILSMGTKMLERLGYHVIPAATPGEAVSLAEEYSGEIDLLMTDVVMPEMNGRELAKRLLSMYPDMKRLFMSGYTANVIAHHGVLEEGVNFIQKPFSLEELSRKVREALEK